MPVPRAALPLPKMFRMMQKRTHVFKVRFLFNIALFTFSRRRTNRRTTGNYPVALVRTRSFTLFDFIFLKYPGRI